MDSSSDDSELYDYMELLQLMPFRRISVPYKVSHEEKDTMDKQCGEQQNLEKLELNHIYTNNHTKPIDKNASAGDINADDMLDNSDGEYIWTGQSIIIWLAECQDI